MVWMGWIVENVWRCEGGKKQEIIGMLRCSCFVARATETRANGNVELLLVSTRSTLFTSWTL